MKNFCQSISIAFILSCYTTQANAVLEAVIVSAARTEQSALTTPASITVISREEIDASGATHVVDLLHGRGGVQVYDNFGSGSLASVGMRGFGETANANTLVLVDGRRLNNTDIAAPDLNVIALDDVERVEIVQGSAGVLFGDQAVGGVINIITRGTVASRQSLKISAGNYETVNFHAMTSQVFDDGYNYRISLDLRESDNYRENNDTFYLNGLTRLGYEDDRGSVFAELQYVDNQVQAPGTLFAEELAVDRRQASANFANDFTNIETTVARLGMKRELSSNWSFEGEATSRNSDSEFVLSSVFGAETQVNPQKRNVKELTPRLIGVIPGLNDLNAMVTLGVDVIQSEYSISSRFGDQFNDQSQQSIYAQLVMPLSSVIDVTFGARHARVENELRDTGGFALFPAGIDINDDVIVGTFGITVKANDNWRVFLRTDQNYRFAKVGEYLQPGFHPTLFTPVILETQEGLSVETGFDWSLGQHSAKFIYYMLDLDNEIIFDPVNFANINLKETERRGVIAEGRWQMSERLGLAVSYTMTNGKVIGGAFKDKEIPLLAEHSGLISSDFQLNTQWQFYGEVQLLSDRVFSGDFNNQLSRLPGHGIVNFKAEYTAEDFVLSGRINNVLNREYSQVGFLQLNPDMLFNESEAYFTSPKLNVLITASWKI